MEFTAIQLISHQIYFAASCTEKSFFGIPSWYHYLVGTMYDKGPDKFGSCTFDFTPGGGSGAIQDHVNGAGNATVLIGLGVVDILLRIIGLVAVGFIIYGGIKYVVSQGEPEKTKNARGTIINAFIGLAIAIVATGVVGFVGGQLGK